MQSYGELDSTAIACDALKSEARKKVVQEQAKNTKARDGRDQMKKELLQSMTLSQ